MRIFNSVYQSPRFFCDLGVDEQFYSTCYFLKLCELIILIPTNCILILPLFSCRKESPAETWGTFAHSCKGRWYLRAEETGMRIEIKIFMKNENIHICTFHSIYHIRYSFSFAYQLPLLMIIHLPKPLTVDGRVLGASLCSLFWMTSIYDSWNVLEHDLVFYKMLGHVKNLIVSNIMSLIIINNILQFPAFPCT